MRLKGKVAIITGGAMGIGKTAVEVFAREGAHVVIWDIDEKNGLALVKKLKAKKLQVEYTKVDITKFEEVETAAAAVAKKYKAINILINNAGIAKNASLKTMTIEQWQQVVDVNLTGVFNCTKAVSAYMTKGSYGRIINTSSLIGIFGGKEQSNFGATKSGVIGITKVWAKELSKDGITVNAVAPGYIDTENINSLSKSDIAKLKKEIPVGRLGKAEDIAYAYLFLASEEASYINGMVLNVDGGYVP